MTNVLQEVFSKIEAHLLTQGQRSEVNQVCKYRYNGLMCAVGCLIDDEHYSTDIEGMCAHSLPYTIIESIFKDNDKDNIEIGTNMLSDLQDMHDMSSIYNWRSHLNKIAYQYNVKTCQTYSTLQP
jgi:hypothetical protein